MMVLASLLFDGVDWGTNPDNHTAGKLLIELPNGKTRVYDPWAAMQSVARLGKSVVTGEDDAVSLLATDIAKKASPQFSFLHSVVFGKDWMNKDINRAEAAVRGLTPISVEGVVDSAFEHTGVLDLVIGTGADILGVGSYVVPTEDLKNKTKWEDRDKKK
jgi:hypothetical protein